MGRTRKPSLPRNDSAPTTQRASGAVTSLALTLSLLFFLCPSLASATPSTDFGFFGPGSISLDFNEIPMSQSTVIVGQYASHGVTFSPNVWFENHRGAIGWDGHNIANFQTGTSTSNPTVDMIFSGVVNGAAMEFTGNASNSFSITALLGGSVVETYTHNQTGCCAPAVVGIEDIQFDTLRIAHTTGGSEFFIADRLTWNLVPEPNTALLLGLGLLGLPFDRRRAR